MKRDATFFFNAKSRRQRSSSSPYVSPILCFHAAAVEDNSCTDTWRVETQRCFGFRRVLSESVARDALVGTQKPRVVFFHVHTLFKCKDRCNVRQSFAVRQASVPSLQRSERRTWYGSIEA